MPETYHFSLSDNPPDTASLAKLLEDVAAGAVLSFEGRVRNHNNSREVAMLEYQVYPVLAEKAGLRILEEEARRYGLLAARAVHRTGALAVGEIAVWVGVASAHRGAAMNGMRAIVERIKYELPVWKKESYADGRVEWVGPDNRCAETGESKEEVPSMSAELLAIYLSDGHDFRGRHGQGRLDHGIIEVPQAECVAGMGLRGDRYFGYKENYKGQITFFDAETVAAVRERFGVPGLSAAAFRRNLLVRGVKLGDWIGRKFRFQGIEFEGAEECRPCYWMDQVVGEGVEEFLKANCGGGMRARILSDGLLTVV